MQDYAKVLPNAQKKFSLLSGFRNGFPTLLYHIGAKPLPASEKLTIFTCNIFPPNIVVWNHLAQKYFGDDAQIFLFDCSGKLDPKLVPGVTVQRYMNAMHPTKIDVFLEKSGSRQKHIWICDDDVFPMSSKALDVIRQEFAQPKTATVSLRPRTHWHFEIGGKNYEPNGSYCIALDREIMNKEQLNAQPADGNTHPNHEGGPQKRYDTLDKSNEILLQRGYRCAVVPQDIRDECVVGFNGTSIAMLLLDYFPTAAKLVEHFDNTTDDDWKGNALYRNFGALLSAQAVLDLYKKITGETYEISTMPSRADMNRIRKRTEPLLQHGRNYTDIDAVYERIAQAL